jgi:hypothetical protein
MLCNQVGKVINNKPLMKQEFTMPVSDRVTSWASLSVGVMWQYGDEGL